MSLNKTKWYFNTTINFTGIPEEDSLDIAVFSSTPIIKSNSSTYYGITFDVSQGKVYLISTYYGDYSFAQTPIYYNDTWVNSNYRTIEFIGEPTTYRISETTLTTWLKANSTRQPNQYYITNDAELSGIADAIRTKGESSSALIFPTGFITAINNLSDGNFTSTIKTGTVEITPSSNTTFRTSSTAVWNLVSHPIDTPSGKVKFKSFLSGTYDGNSITASNETFDGNLSYSNGVGKLILRTRSGVFAVEANKTLTLNFEYFDIVVS